MQSNVKEMWRVKVPRELVNRLDEVKWQKRCSRNHLVERMFKLAIWLFENNQFERVEALVMSSPDSSESFSMSPVELGLASAESAPKVDTRSVAESER